MKSKNLIYICIGAILIITCILLVYTNLDNESNLIENVSKINNINSSVDTNPDNSTNKVTQVKDIKGSNSSERKNEPNNIPKKSRLSYSEAFNISNTFTGSGDNPIETYMKYSGYVQEKGNLYWKFKMHAKKIMNF